MKTKPLVLGLFLWSMGLTVLIQIAGAADQPQQIDERIILRVGSNEVSRYILDKYYGRFADAERQKDAGGPTREAKRRWLELFLAQQVIIAHAAAQGYSDHPDVQRIVSSVERYMLTQPEGPFYQLLYDPAPISEVRQAQLYAERSMFRQISIVHFKRETDASVLFADGFDALPPEEKRRRLACARDDANATFYDGPMAWPFEPYCEIADFLRTTSAGEWFEHRADLLGLYLGFVEAVETRPLPSTTEDKVQFVSLIREIDKRTFRRQRRAELLAASDLQINERTLTRLSEKLKILPPDTSQIPTDLIAPFGGMPLFEYLLGSRRITVTVGDYGQHFGNMILRRFPGTLPLLRLGIEDMVVEALDFQAAMAQGVSKTPQFSHDRRGFLGLQMLDTFEKEVLRPTIHVGPEEVERYYREHSAEFSRISRIRGRLFTFATKAQLDTWNGGTSPEAKVQTVELTRETPLAGFEPFHRSLIEGPIGTRSGPVRRGEKYLVYVKDANSELAPLSLSAAFPDIRARLERRYLDEKELRLATELCRRFLVEDLINYSDYGVASAEMKLPWRH
jgi:hypothetical protein